MEVGLRATTEVCGTVGTGYCKRGFMEAVRIEISFNYISYHLSIASHIQID